MNRSTALSLLTGAAIALGVASLSVANGAGQVITVEQKGRMFEPTTLEVNVGDIVRIVNNDGDLLHHAYVDSDTFDFDSGEQEPGTSMDIPFTTPGTFEVLCGIHPKMRLVVTVKAP